MTALTRGDRQCAIDCLTLLYSRSELQRLLRVALDLELEWVVPNAGLAEQVSDLVAYAERHLMTGRLLRAAAAERPADAGLRDLARRYPPVEEEPVRPDEALIEKAAAAFDAVPGILRSDQGTLNRLSDYRAAYQDAATHVDLLQRYKKLHHCLHMVEMKEREIGNSAEALANPRTAVKAAVNLRIYSDQLKRTADLTAVIEGLKESDAEMERTWLDNLNKATGWLNEAAQEKDPGKAEDARWLLERIVASDPARIQQRIFEHFESLPMADLVFSLRVLQVAEAKPEVRASLAEGLVAFEETQRRLGRLVQEHCAWQNLGNSIRLARKSYRRVSEYLEEMMAGSGDGGGPADEDAGGGGGTATLVAQRTTVSPGTRRHIGMLLDDLRDVAWKYSKLQSRATAVRLGVLNQYAEDLSQATRGQDPAAIVEPFESFCALALSGFVEVDKDLLELADQLTRIGGPLKTILEVLQCTTTAAH